MAVVAAAAVDMVEIWEVCVAHRRSRPDMKYGGPIPRRCGLAFINVHRALTLCVCQRFFGLGGLKLRRGGRLPRAVSRPKPLLAAGRRERHLKSVS